MTNEADTLRENAHYKYYKDLIDINWSKKYSGINIVNFQKKKFQGWDFYKYPEFCLEKLIDHTLYMSLGMTLTQFYINFSRQGHQIELILVVINS